jgi:membrane-associated PAP2 superfamily phosphatase
LKRWLLAQAAGLALAALVIDLGLARSGLDFRLSALAYSPEARGFPLRDAGLATALGHKGLNYLADLLWLGLLGVAAASRTWRREALHAALGAALAATAATTLRNWSAHSCPWDLALYGGTAQWFALLGEMPADPGPGRCLPSGHAASGFAFFSLYFALRDAHPRLARAGLALAALLGILAAAAQVARGAHFASHSAWTAWVAWAVNVALYLLIRRLKSPLQPPIPPTCASTNSPPSCRKPSARPRASRSGATTSTSSPSTCWRRCSPRKTGARPRSSPRRGATRTP